MLRVCVRSWHFSGAMLPSPAATGSLSRLKFWKPFLEWRLFTTFRDSFPTTNSAWRFPRASDYFAFALVGFAFFDYLTVSLSAFDSSITEAQQNGTLEAMLVTETPLTMILIASAAYPFVLLAMRTVIYLAWGVLVFSFPHSRSQLAGSGDHSGRLRFWPLPAWELFRPATCCCSSAAIPRAG